MSLGEAGMLSLCSAPGGFGAVSAEEIAFQTARRLLEIRSVTFSGEPFYQLTSGRKSPVYVDCRKIISYPNIARFVTESACARLHGREFDAIAGGETAGIPFAAWIAARMEKPMLYVRKKPKGFGLHSQIEGVMPQGVRGRKPRVLLVEDHATDGKSKIHFVHALRKAGAETDTAFVVFYYDIFAQAKKALEQENIDLVSLTTWRETLQMARETPQGLGLEKEETLREVEAFLQDPVAWQKAHP